MESTPYAHRLTPRAVTAPSRARRVHRAGGVASAVLAWYMASSLLLNSAFGRNMLPVVRYRKYSGYDVVHGFGEPGVTPYE